MDFNEMRLESQRPRKRLFQSLSTRTRWAWKKILVVEIEKKGENQEYLGTKSAEFGNLEMSIREVSQKNIQVSEMNDKVDGLLPNELGEEVQFRAHSDGSSEVWKA